MDQPLQEIEQLISRTEALNWNDNHPSLKPNSTSPDTQTLTSKLIHVNINPYAPDILKLIKLLIRSHLSAWQNSIHGSVPWQPHPPGSVKANFDVAIRSTFAVAAAVLSDSNGCIISAITHKLHFVDVNMGGKLMQHF
jgi:hypothetical protein